MSLTSASSRGRVTLELAEPGDPLDDVRTLELILNFDTFVIEVVHRSQTHLQSPKNIPRGVKKARSHPSLSSKFTSFGHRGWLNVLLTLQVSLADHVLNDRGTRKRFDTREQYRNNLRTKPSQTVANNPKAAPYKELSFQLPPLIQDDLGPLVGALKRPASAVRSRLSPPFCIL